MERLQDRFRAAHTQVLGISVDSKFCHAGWAVSLGGISFPLLADFQPKGATAQAYGLYLDGPGITDRATVIIDAGGIVRHASSVTPAGSRDIAELAALCEGVDKAYEGKVPPRPERGKLPAGMQLYVKGSCGFSAWTLQARQNLRLESVLPVKNVTDDAKALAELEKGGGKAQAPCLRMGDEWLFESKDIIAKLVDLTAKL